MKKRPTCGTCRHFVEKTVGGVCHLNPPTVLVVLHPRAETVVDSHWFNERPWVVADDFCGQHKEKA